MVRKQRPRKSSNDLFLAYFWAIMTEGRRLCDRPNSSVVFVNKLLLGTEEPPGREPRLKQRLQVGDPVATIHTNRVGIITGITDTHMRAVWGDRHAVNHPLVRTYKCVDIAVLPKLPLGLRETATAKLLRGLIAWIVVNSGRATSTRLQNIADKLAGSGAYLQPGFKGVNLDDPISMHAIAAALPGSESITVVGNNSSGIGRDRREIPRKQFVPYTREYLDKYGTRDIDWRGASY